MMDTLYFRSDGTFEFIHSPADAAIHKRYETGKWRMKNGDLTLYDRQNEIGGRLPKETLVIKTKGSRKLRIYYNVGGVVANHYEQYTALVTKK